MNEKVLKNALLLEKMYVLDKDERREVLLQLLTTHTQRGLAKELGIPYATLHDWVSQRQDNTGKHIHISFDVFYRKIKCMNEKDITDWGRLEMIKERIEELLRKKP